MERPLGHGNCSKSGYFWVFLVDLQHHVEVNSNFELANWGESPPYVFEKGNLKEALSQLYIVFVLTYKSAYVL